MPPILNASAQMMCPHGGKVVVVPSAMNVKVGGMPVLTLGDVPAMTIVGCVMNVSGAPAPCLKVAPLGGFAMKVKANMQPVLLQTTQLMSVGPAPGPIIIASPGQVTVQGT